MTCREMVLMALYVIPMGIMLLANAVWDAPEDTLADPWGVHRPLTPAEFNALAEGRDI